MLGYVIALKPTPFLKLFGIKGDAKQVGVEHHEIDGRSDIQIITTHGIGVVEAKIDGSNPIDQVLRYDARWHICLCKSGIPSSIRQQNKQTHFHWEKLKPILKKLASSNNHRERFVAEDLIRYMEEHNLINPDDPIEIYARELNDEATLKAFISGRMYGCWYEKNSRLPEAMYFAPHFGKAIARVMPGIDSGISYIARIKSVEEVHTWKDFVDAIRSGHGKAWWNSNQDHYLPLKSAWSWQKGVKPRRILILGAPRLVFNPPVKKDHLQKGKGWLSKRFITFDELFAAWKT